MYKVHTGDITTRAIEETSDPLFYSKSTLGISGGASCNAPWYTDPAPFFDLMVTFLEGAGFN